MGEVIDNMTNMPPGAVMMAYFPLAGPDLLFYKENLGNDLVPIAIIFFFIMGEDRKIVVVPV